MSLSRSAELVNDVNTHDDEYNRNVMRGLVDLPELALEVVLKYLPFYSIKQIRLVNRGLYHLVTKLKSDFNLWTVTSQNFRANQIPDFVLNSTKDIAIKLKDCEDDTQLCFITNIFKRRIKRVTIEVDEILFHARSCRLYLWDLEYLKIVLLEQVSARIPWLAPTLLDSASTMHTLHLVGVGLDGIQNSRAGLVFSAMKSLSIRFSYVCEKVFAVSFPNLEELYLSASGMRKFNGAIGPGFNKLKILYVRDCSGDISRITKAIAKRSQSTLQQIMIGDMQQFPLGYEPGTVEFPALKNLLLACFVIPEGFLKTHCPVLNYLVLDNCIFPSISKSQRVLPLFSRIEFLRVVEGKGEVANLLHNLVISCKSTMQTLHLFGDGDSIQFPPKDVEDVKFDTLSEIYMGSDVEVTAEFFKIQCPKIRKIGMYDCKLPEKIHQVSQDFVNLKDFCIERCTGDVEGLLKFCPHATKKKFY